MRRFTSCLAMLIAAGCVSEPYEAEPLATIAAVGPPVQCINLDQVISRRPAGPRSLVFELTGGRRYRNDLPDQCPSLERAGSAEIVHVETTGSRLCQNDRVRIYDPVEARNIGLASFPHCLLGPFIPIARR